MTVVDCSAHPLLPEWPTVELLESFFVIFKERLICVGPVDYGQSRTVPTGSLNKSVNFGISLAALWKYKILLNTMCVFPRRNFGEFVSRRLMVKTFIAQKFSF